MPSHKRTHPMDVAIRVLGLVAVTLLLGAAYFVLGFNPPQTVERALEDVRSSAETTTPPVLPDGTLDSDGKPITADPRSYPAGDPRRALETPQEVMVYNSCLSGQARGAGCAVLHVPVVPTEPVIVPVPQPPDPLQLNPQPPVIVVPPITGSVTIIPAPPVTTTATTTQAPPPVQTTTEIPPPVETTQEPVPTVEPTQDPITEEPTTEESPFASPIETIQESFESLLPQVP